MKQAEYHTLNPLIRAKELELLSSELFEQLVQAENLEKAAELLNPTCYSGFIRSGFEHEFSREMDKEQEKLFHWLIEMAPEKKVVWVYTMRFTFHNLKILTKAEFLDKNFDHLFVPDGFFSIQELKELLRSEEAVRFPPELQSSVNEVKEYLKESTVLQGIDVIYDRYFLIAQRRIGEELDYPELLSEIIHFIDLTNIILLLRGLYQGRNRAFMDSVLSSEGELSKEILLSFVDLTPTSFINFLKETIYAEELKGLMVNDTLDPAQLERFKDNFLTNLYQSAQTQAFGPLPLLAFLNAKEIERKNLQLIVTAKRSGIEVERIRERLRVVYDS